MVAATIDRVRVYSQGALVTRRAVLDTHAEGLEVPGLPLSLVDPTVRVRSLTSGVVAGAVRIGLHARPPEELPDTPDEEALRAVRRRIETVDRSLEAIEGEVDLLRDLEVPPRPRGEKGKPPPASPMRARVALDQFTNDAIEARLDEARTLRRERVGLEEEAAALEDAIARASTAREARPDQVTKTVLCTLSGEAEGAVEVEIEYFVPGARWAPQYQCDIAADGSEAVLKLRALVCQASGEDWRGVALELSTAAPQDFTELPKLSSIRIGKAQRVPPGRGYREAPKGAGALFADFDRGWTVARAALPDLRSSDDPELYVEPLEAPVVFGGVASGVFAEIEEEDDLYADDMATESIQLDARELDGMVGGAAPAPEPQPAAKPAMALRSTAAPRRRSEMKKKGRPPPAPPGGAPNDQEEPWGEEGAAAAPSVSFARLRLGAPKSGHRAVLRPVDPASDYLDLLRRSGLSVRFDVARVVRDATRRAAQAAHTTLPGGAVEVRDASGQFDYAYRADDRVDVPSDLAFHSVPLGTRTAPCEVTYVVVPRVDTNVFRVASVRNPTAAPLLPGPAEVYVNGEYVLSTTLPIVPPEAKFELGLGVEQALRCVRNTRFREERAGKNVVAMAELHHEIEIELHNPLGRAIHCEVRERVPQAAPDAEVDVEEVAVEPPWDEWDQVEVGPKLEGGRRWEVDVAARSAATLEAHYVVKIYANNEIVGGNRREA